MIEKNCVFIASQFADNSKTKTGSRGSLTDDRDIFRRMINLVEALAGGAGADDRRFAVAVLVVLLLAALGVGVFVALSLKD